MSGILTGFSVLMCAALSFPVYIPSRSPEGILLGGLLAATAGAIAFSLFRSLQLIHLKAFAGWLYFTANVVYVVVVGFLCALRAAVG